MSPAPFNKHLKALFSFLFLSFFCIIRTLNPPVSLIEILEVGILIVLLRQLVITQHLVIEERVRDQLQLLHHF